jgi:amino acid permease
MKIVLRIVLFIALALIIFGFYSNLTEEGQGKKFIGFGVLIFAFILMPLFIYHRYNGKDLSRYSMRNMFQEKEQMENEKDKR